MPIRRHAVTMGAAVLAVLGAACRAPDAAARAAELDAYRGAFVAAAGTAFDAARPRGAWLADTAAARVLWLGDHHRSRELHRLQRDLLRELAATGRPLLLALEAVGTQDRPWLDAFLGGGLSLDELAAAMRRRWPPAWLDGDDVDSAHYRALLQFAREHRLRVVPLEPTPRGALALRDATIAASVRAAAQQHPQHLVVVVVGQTHLLGGGCVVARVDLPAVVCGGEPTAPLRAAAPPRDADEAPDAWWRSTGGLWWFAARCRAGARDAAP
jgi:hypothetical protein